MKIIAIPFPIECDRIGAILIHFMMILMIPIDTSANLMMVLIDTVSSPHDSMA